MPGSLQDIAGRWATISEDKKEELRKEAEQCNNSLEFDKDRPMKIKRQMNVKGIMRSMHSKVRKCMTTYVGTRITYCAVKYYKGP